MPEPPSIRTRSPDLVNAVAERADADPGLLERMTFAGCVPTVLHRFALEPGPAQDTSAFDSSVRQHGVLFAPGEARSRSMRGWRSWLPAQPVAAKKQTSR